jgi:hypothetical protein
VTDRRPRPTAALRRRFGTVAAGCATLAVVLLAPLAAGLGIDAPPTSAEVAHLEQALGGDGAAPARGGSEIVRLWFRAAAGADASVPPDDAGRVRLVARARLSQVLVIGAIAGLVYVAVLLARGRLQALLASAALAGLPPVLQEGARLRPEGLATALVLLATVLLQCFAQTASRRAPGARWRRAVSLLGLGACAALALGLALATLPSAGAPVLLPGLVVTLGAAWLGVRALRVARRTGLERLPCRALNGRLLPWTALALVVPAVAILELEALISAPIEDLPATRSQAALLPGTGWLRGAAWTLLGGGAVAAVLRVGLRLGRGGRIGAEVVLLVYGALGLAAAWGAPPGADPLPAAPALAIVLAEGLRLVLTGMAWFAHGRPRPR